MMKHGILIASCGQWVSAFVSAFGICYEIISGADLGYVFVTTGALLFAISTKVKYLKEKKQKWKEKS